MTGVPTESPSTGTLPATRYGHAPGTSMPRSLRFKRVALAAATSFAAVNIWTGCPLLAVWIGAATESGPFLSTRAVAVVIAVLAASVYAMAVLLVRLNAAYDDLIERPHTEGRAAWLESMRGVDEPDARARRGDTAIERAVVASVYLAVIALTAWFAFFSGPPFVHG